MGSPLADVLYVYRIDPGADRLHPRLAGKVLVSGGHIQVLADYHGQLGPLEGPLEDDARWRAWRAILHSPYFESVTAEEMRAGARPDLLPQVPVSAAAEPAQAEPARAEAPPGRFSYHHAGLNDPVLLEVDDGRVMLNGTELSPPEASRLLENVRSGAARIRYDRDPRTAAVAKVEEALAYDMRKIEPALAAALEQVRGAVKAGHVHPDVLRALTHEIFADPMVGGVGNKKAYSDFASRPRDGVHVRMDANDFGQINKVHGFAAGDQAIRSLGGAMREAMDETVGSKHGKLYRIGGDEFHAHVPTHEHASAFARALRSKLDALAPAGGTHAHSVSMGFGSTPEQADAASIAAKQAKRASGYAPGRARTHAHSLVPGREGAIPVDAEQLPASSPPAEMRPAPAPAQGTENSSEPAGSASSLP
jgi:GGDEF domain-containing protein